MKRLFWVVVMGNIISVIYNSVGLIWWGFSAWYYLAGVNLVIVLLMLKSKKRVPPTNIRVREGTLESMPESLREVFKD